MESRLFSTSNGDVPVWGRLDEFSSERQLVLVIRGAFAELDQMIGLEDAVPHVDVAYVHLPGIHSPFFAEHSISSFAAAFDEVLDALGHQRVKVLGLSLGGVVAMAMRSPSLETLIIIDTPLSTGPLWMMPAICRALSREEPRLVDWSWDLFGVRGDEIVNRDYQPFLAALAVRTGIIIGGEPIGLPRPLAKDPGAVSEEDRALYAAHPLVSVRVVPGIGHNIPKYASWLILDAVRRVTGYHDQARSAQ